MCRHTTRPKVDLELWGLHGGVHVTVTQQSITPVSEGNPDFLNPPPVLLESPCSSLQQPCTGPQTHLHPALAKNAAAATLHPLQQPCTHPPTHVHLPHDALGLVRDVILAAAAAAARTGVSSQDRSAESRSRCQDSVSSSSSSSSSQDRRQQPGQVSRSKSTRRCARTSCGS